MKIAFLCASAAAGRDGVGDYVRRLGEACVARGHTVLIIALHDKHLSDYTVELLPTGPQVLRWPAKLNWLARRAGVRQTLDEFQPDWVSWQMVSYGYQPRGILGAEIAALASELSDWPTHVMMHEIWIGCAQGASFYDRLTGWVQRRALGDFLRAARPRVLHTSNENYARSLAPFGEARVLPLFGNIPFHPLSPAAQQQLFADFFPGLDRERTLFAVTFGTLHPQWQPEATAQLLTAAAQLENRSVVLLAIGRIGAHGVEILKRLASEGVTIATTGELSPATVSGLLQAADVGITVHPRALLGKSGSVAAMRDHGLPVLVPRDDWQLRLAPVPALALEPELARVADLDAPAASLWLRQRNGPRDSLQITTNDFLNTLAA